jgi:protein-glutamine gamma-glutamyltransferase
MTMTATISAPSDDSARAPTASPEPAHDPSTGGPQPSVGLSRLRIAVLGIGYLVVGAAAGGIFDHSAVGLVLAPVLPTAAALLTAGARARWRLAAAVGSVVATGALAALAHDGGARDVTTAFTGGVQRLLSTEWPSPRTPELIVTVAVVIATAAAISHELARHRRLHLVPLLPLLLCALAVIGLSAPLGVRWWWLVPLGAVAVLVAMLRNDGTLHDRVVLVRGERRIVPLLLIGAAIVGLVTVPLVLTDRADPRRDVPAGQTLPLLDPIQATVALRALDPPIDLHVATPAGEQSLPSRWRTAALVNYDSARWTPALRVRPIGTTLGAVDGPVVRADVSFLDERLSLVPLPGPPVSVDAEIETDTSRSVVRLARVPAPGERVAIVAGVAPTTGDAVEQGLATRLVDTTRSPLTDLAERLAGGGTPLDRVTRLESTLRDDFVLDTEVPGGGMQQALIERFLRETQRGNREQFVTAFVLLTRSLGIEARIATGFLAGGTDTVSMPGEPLTLTSADAYVWPEVQLADGGWLAFDPVPVDEADDEAPTPPQPQVQTPAAPQPPIPPPPEPGTETRPPDGEETTTPPDALSTVLTWAARGALGLGILLLPFALAAGVVLGVKYRRRRRRLAAAAALDRIRGAWASATDALVDAGLDIEPSRTDGEIVARAEPLVADVRRDLRRLASLSSAATFGRPRHPELLADDAARCLDSIEASLAGDRTRWQRARWRLSLRSLRASTKSPVIA